MNEKREAAQPQPPSPPPPPSSAQSNGPTARGFIAGIASGATKLAVGHPFDTIKVRLQTEGLHGRFGGAIDCLKKTVHREGFRGLYKGATPPLFGWAMMDSIQLGTLTNLRLAIQRSHADPTQPLSMGEHALAGLGAGITVSFVAAPVELLKAKLQVQYGDTATLRYTGPVDCARQIARAHRFGVLGLWSQLPATLLFRSWFWLLWGSYEVYTQSLRRSTYVSPALIPFLAGGLAANTFWVFSFPADVIKNRLMAAPLPMARAAASGLTPYTSIAATARHIYRTEGTKGFFRGFWTCQLRSFPTNGAALIVFEFLNRELHWV
ncbi:mitochondrial carrier domain-containing protein [Blastocladiella britannica]|nr:mitochondrial carrier domain-containing protein [Blastocladiella britannica]